MELDQASAELESSFASRISNIDSQVQKKAQEINSQLSQVQMSFQRQDSYGASNNQYN